MAAQQLSALSLLDPAPAAAAAAGPQKLDLCSLLEAYESAIACEFPNKGPAAFGDVAADLFAEMEKGGWWDVRCASPKKHLLELQLLFLEYLVTKNAELAQSVRGLWIEVLEDQPAVGPVEGGTAADATGFEAEWHAPKDDLCGTITRLVPMLTGLNYLDLDLERLPDRDAAELTNLLCDRNSSAAWTSVELLRLRTEYRALFSLVIGRMVPGLRGLDVKMDADDTRLVVVATQHPKLERLVLTSPYEPFIVPLASMSAGPLNSLRRRFKSLRRLTIFATLPPAEESSDDWVLTPEQYDSGRKAFLAAIKAFTTLERLAVEFLPRMTRRYRLDNGEESDDSAWLLTCDMMAASKKLQAVAVLDGWPKYHDAFRGALGNPIVGNSTARNLNVTTAGVPRTCAAWPVGLRD